MTPRVKNFIISHRSLLEINDLGKFFEEALDEFSVISMKVLLKYFKDSSIIDENFFTELTIRTVIQDYLEDSTHMMWLSEIMDDYGCSRRPENIEEWVEAIKQDRRFQLWKADANLTGEPDYLVGIKTTYKRNHTLLNTINSINNQYDSGFYADDFERVV